MQGLDSSCKDHGPYLSMLSAAPTPAPQLPRTHAPIPLPRPRTPRAARPRHALTHPHVPHAVAHAQESSPLRRASAPEPWATAEDSTVTHHMQLLLLRVVRQRADDVRCRVPSLIGALGARDGESQWGSSVGFR
jgi:hypothetical protein